MQKLAGVNFILRALPPGMVNGVLPFQDDLRNGNESNILLVNLHGFHCQFRFKISLFKYSVLLSDVLIG